MGNPYELFGYVIASKFYVMQEELKKGSMQKLKQLLMLNLKSFLGMHLLQDYNF